MSVRRMFESRHRATMALAIAVGVATACQDSSVTSPEGAEISAARRGGPASSGAVDGGQTYVLTAARWSAKQDKAVADAGGTILWSHAEAGIGAVTSANPSFLEELMEGTAFQSGAADQVVRWQPDVRTMELDQSTVTPNDEGFFPFQWNMQAIDAPGAWARGADGSGASVAVLDGGFYDVHPDLANLDTSCSVSFVPGQPYNTDTGTFWHGTHVMGIVGAADNGFGVIGVAPEARLMGVKVLHNGSGAFSWIIGGILFASNPAAFGFDSCARADIINMSLSAEGTKAGGAGPIIGAVAKAVNYAASQNVLVISAASNDGRDVTHTPNWTVIPAMSGSGLAVSATGPVGFIYGATNYRRFASYSNWGESLVTVAAPGGDFTLLLQNPPDPNWFFDMVLSTSRGATTPPVFSFSFAAGTSMAAPAAAGVAALIVGENPGISLGALKAKLKNSADDEGKVGFDEFYGHGFVNANNAVR